MYGKDASRNCTANDLPIARFMLREIAPDVWAIETPFELVGMKMGARMTIVRRANGDLWVYAPFAVSDEEADAIREKGEVRLIVAPSIGHFTEISDFARRFPDATLWALPQLENKLKDVPHQKLETMPEEWNADFDGLFFDGALLFREWVFCHRASQTLLMVDLAFHLPRPQTPLNRIAARLNDVGRHFAPSRIERTTMKLGDKKREREHLNTILSWNFTRIVPGHGFVVERAAKKQLRRAFRFLGV